MSRTRVALISIVAVALLATAAPSLAESPAAPPANAVLMVLAPPTLPRSVPAESVPSQFFARAYERQSRLVPILTSLKRHKRIASFELLPDANAIRVVAPDPPAALMLSRLPGVSAVIRATPERIKALRENSRAAMLRAASTAARTQKRPRGATQNPYVQINETGDNVWGYDLAPNTPVTAVLKDSGGNIKSTATATTLPDGRFLVSFWDGGDGEILPGDSVEVTVNGWSAAVSDVVTIDFDYANDRVFGTAAPNRTIEVNAGNTSGYCAYPPPYNQQVTSDPLGNYSADFAGILDVSHRTDAFAISYDANGNAWIVERHAPWVILNMAPLDSYGWGYALNPGETVTVTLKSGATVKQTVKTESDDNYASFGFNFDMPMMPGNAVEISEGGATWVPIPVVKLNANLDPKTDLVTGDAPANQAVEVSGSHYDPSTGDRTGQCKTGTANALGKYSVNLGLNFIGGDDAVAEYYDADGHGFRWRDYAPYLQTYVDEFSLNGSFHSNFEGDVFIVVKSAAGVQKYKGTGSAYGGWWDQMLVKGGQPVMLRAGDKVTVVPLPAGSSGGQLNGTVARLTANIDLANDRIAGTAPPNSRLTVRDWFWSAWPWGGGSYNYDESESTLANAAGAYSYQFRRDLVAGDYVESIYTDVQGYRTIAHGYSTTPTIKMVSYPNPFRRQRSNEVKFNIANGLHVENVYFAWDSASRPDWNYVNQDYAGMGGPGDYTVNVWVVHRGKIYFRAFAQVDGRLLFTAPENSALVR